MSHPSFKQFNAYIETPLDEERVDEIFGMFKSKEAKEKAEKQKLELLAKRGNLAAQMKLRQLQKNAEVASARDKAERDSKEVSFKTAKANVEHGERGSSRAYDAETGSAGRKFAPRWNGAKKTWERYEAGKWVPTGDTDRYSEPEKRGTR